MLFKVKGIVAEMKTGRKKIKYIAANDEKAGTPFTGYH